MDRLVRRWSLQHLGWFVGLGTVGILTTAIQPAWANDDQAMVATTVEEWLAQIAQSTVIEVTGIRLLQTDTGLDVILETLEGEVLQPSSSVMGNAVIVDIPNAVLELPEGDEFQQSSPIDGIAFVSITNLPGNGVRVAITGSDAPPTTDIRAESQALVLGVAPGVAGADVADPDAIQVVATGEEEAPYRVQDTTTATRTDTSILEVPQSIQIVPREVLEDQGARDLGDVARNVAGLNQFSVYQDFTLRGFRISDESVFYNGLRGNPYNYFTSSPVLGNVERVEVRTYAIERFLGARSAPKNRSNTGFFVVSA